MIGINSKNFEKIVPYIGDGFSVRFQIGKGFWSLLKILKRVRDIKADAVI
jgi:hypothetical protein